MRKYLIILHLILIIIHLSLSETKGKKISATRLNEKIKIDGLLTESFYVEPSISDFTQRDPIEGEKPTHKTEIWIGYDDEAIYIGAMLHDSSPDSIVKQLGRRDSFLKSDWFMVVIDSYFDKRNAFFFGINPAGSIIDGTFYNDGWDDDSWDGIWERAVTMNEKGWCAELKIPYSQLRFSKKEEYTWGFNAMRIIGRYNEEDYLVMVPKKESGFVSHFAELVGIKNINPPSRFEVLPYIVSGGEFTKNYTPGDPFNTGKKFIKNIGTDLKLGISSNVTLDATINPDFGQVEVDPAEVNLTQFETYYSEKRPFFIEGSNIFRFGVGGVTNNMNFNWSNPQFFYSRRIGRKPQRNDLPEFNNSPNATTILAAGKISGKLNNNQSIGILAALTEREIADVQDDIGRYKLQVEPFSFYGIGRTQYEFDQGRYGIGYIITSVERDTRDTTLAKSLNHRSYTFGSDGWVFLDQNKSWVMNGWIGLSHVSGSKERLLKIQRAPQRYFQRPDAKHLSIDSSATSLTGMAGRFTINKEKNNWIFNSAFGFLSPAFETNDLGFQYNADVYNAHIASGYKWYEPDKLFRFKSFLIAIARNYNFGGDKTSEIYFANVNLVFTNYWGFNSRIFYIPRSLDTKSTRGGPAMLSPQGYNFRLWFDTDRRKNIILEFSTGISTNEIGGKELELESEIEWKPFPYLNFRLEPSYNYNLKKYQYISTIDDTLQKLTYGKRYIFGELKQNTISANIRMNYTFTPTLSLQIYLQPLISVGKYNNIKELSRPRSFEFNVYGTGISTIEKDDNGEYIIDPDGAGVANKFLIGNSDFNFKSLRLNLVLRWEYLPGSTLYLVWTQNKNNDLHPGTFHFKRDFKDLISADGDNAVMLKLTYWFNL